MIGTKETLKRSANWVKIFWELNCWRLAIEQRGGKNKTIKSNFTHSQPTDLTSKFICYLCLLYPIESKDSRQLAKYYKQRAITDIKSI